MVLLFFQNKRCSTVFKTGNRVYDIDGTVFWEWWTDPDTGERSKTFYTCSESTVDITFPYTKPDKPKVEYRESV